jgi:putative RecB family exonuclease
VKSTILKDGPARQPVGDLWDYVSPSRLNLWLKCPLAFRFRYVERIPTPTSASLLVGKMVHGALEYFNCQRQAGTTPQVSQVVSHLASLWDESLANDPVAFDSADQEKKFSQQALDLVLAYLAHPLADEPPPLAVERAMEAPLVDPSGGRDLGLPLVGIVDLVVPGPLGAVIVDYKTAARSAAPLATDHEIQLSCYAYLFREEFGSEEGTLEIRKLVKTKVPQIQVHTWPKRSEKDFRRLFAVIRAYLHDLDAGRFYFRPGLGCSFCDFRQTHSRNWQG